VQEKFQDFEGKEMTDAKVYRSTASDGIAGELRQHRHGQYVVGVAEQDRVFERLLRSIATLIQGGGNTAHDHAAADRARQENNGLYRRIGSRIKYQVFHKSVQ
jgi:hypothetical protein